MVGLALALFWSLVLGTVAASTTGSPSLSPPITEHTGYPRTGHLGWLRNPYSTVRMGVSRAFTGPSKLSVYPGAYIQL